MRRTQVGRGLEKSPEGLGLAEGGEGSEGDEAHGGGGEEPAQDLDAGREHVVAPVRRHEEVDVEEADQLRREERGREGVCVCVGV